MTVSDAAKEAAKQIVAGGYCCSLQTSESLIQRAIDTATMDLRQQLADAQAENERLRENILCAEDGRAVLASSDAVVEENASLRARVAELEKALLKAQGHMHSVAMRDQTMEYKYGETDGVGEKPPIGERWLTPLEIAKKSICEIQKALGGKGGEGEEWRNCAWLCPESMKL